MNTREQLINWGNWARDRCGPPGYPNESIYTRAADKGSWTEDGWGTDRTQWKPDLEEPPEEVPPTINEKEALRVDYLILTIKSERLKLALLIEYACAPKSFRFKRYGYTESVDEALRLMDDLLTGQSKKAQILRLLADPRRHTETEIAGMVGCSKQYVCQLRAA